MNKLPLNSILQYIESISDNVAEFDKIYKFDKDDLWLSTYSFINNSISEVSESRDKIAVLWDYFFFSVRLGKYKNIKNDVRKLIKINDIDIIDLYRIIKIVTTLLCEACTYLFNSKALYNLFVKAYGRDFKSNLDSNCDAIMDLLNGVKSPLFKPIKQIEYIDVEEKEDIKNAITTVIVCNVSSVFYSYMCYVISILKPYRFNLAMLKDTKMYNKTTLSQLHDCIAKNAVEVSALLPIDRETKRYIVENKNILSPKVLAEHVLNTTVSKRKYVSNNMHFLPDTIENLEIETVLCIDYIKKLLPDIADIYLKEVNPYSDIAEAHLKGVQDNECTCVIHPKLVEAFKKRSFLTPTHGISLHNNSLLDNQELSCLNYVRAIDLDIFERHYNDNNYIIAVDTTITPVFTIINLNTGILYSNSLAVYDTLMTLMYFYKVEDYVNRFKETGEYILYTSFFPSTVNINGLATFKGSSNIYKEVEVTVPYYWRRKNKGVTNAVKKYCEESKLPNLGTYTDIIKISPFKRKLRKGTKASEEALLLAKKYCVILEEGETFVRPFDRKQKKILKPTK